MRRAAILLLTVAGIGCEHQVDVEPIEIKPITATVNVNIKVDRKLQRFFAFEEKIREQQAASSKGEPSDSEDGPADADKGEKS